MTSGNGGGFSTNKQHGVHHDDGQQGPFLQVIDAIPQDLISSRPAGKGKSPLKDHTF